MYFFVAIFTGGVMTDPYMHFRMCGRIMIIMIIDELMFPIYSVEHRHAYTVHPCV